MSTGTLISAFTLVDLAALALLVAGWLAIGWFIEHPPRSHPSVSALMSRYRLAWMRALAQRDQRIFDAAILQNLRDATAFFASTCLIAIGGVLALAGNPQPLQQAAQAILHDSLAPQVWQGKLLIVVLFLTNGFLAFVWANRLFGYFSVLIGAVPNEATDSLAQHRAAQAGQVSIRAAVNFNRGLRSIYFALAALAWLLGPYALMAAACATVWTLWQREFKSLPRQILLDRPPEAPEP